MSACGHKCHTDYYPRYQARAEIRICDDCKTEPCETVLEEQRMEVADKKEE